MGYLVTYLLKDQLTTDVKRKVTINWPHNIQTTNIKLPLTFGPTVNFVSRVFLYCHICFVVIKYVQTAQLK